MNKQRDKMQQTMPMVAACKEEMNRPIVVYYLMQFLITRSSRQSKQSRTGQSKKGQYLRRAATDRAGKGMAG